MWLENPKKVKYLWIESAIDVASLTSQKKKRSFAKIKKSWKNTRVSKKQAKAFPTTTTNKEKESHWGICKWKKNIFKFSIKGLKKRRALSKEISGKKS